jgi:ABC-type transport system involved in cytochrome c biogenesis permease subunit
MIIIDRPGINEKALNLRVQGFNRSMLRKSQRTKETTFQLWIWSLFIASAVFFTASSLRNGDILGLLGSLCFLVACIMAVVPLVASESQSSQKE